MQKRWQKSEKMAKAEQKHGRRELLSDGLQTHHEVADKRGLADAVLAQK